MKYAATTGRQLDEVLNMTIPQLWGMMDAEKDGATASAGRKPGLSLAEYKRRRAEWQKKHGK